MLTHIDMHADLGEVLFWWGTFLMGIDASTTIIPCWTIASRALAFITCTMMIYFITKTVLKHHWKTAEYMYARGKGYARGA